MARPRKIMKDEEVVDETPLLSNQSEKPIETENKMQSIEVILERPKTNYIVDSAIKFLVDYSPSFKGVKRFENKSIILVSVESAKLFEQKGIGKIV